MNFKTAMAGKEGLSCSLTMGTQLQLYDDLNEYLAEFDEIHLERAAIDKKDLNPKEAQRR